MGMETTISSHRAGATSTVWSGLTGESSTDGEVRYSREKLRFSGSTNSSPSTLQGRRRAVWTANNPTAPPSVAMKRTVPDTGFRRTISSSAKADGGSRRGTVFSVVWPVRMSPILRCDPVRLGMTVVCYQGSPVKARRGHRPVK